MEGLYLTTGKIFGIKRSFIPWTKGFATRKHEKKNLLAPKFCNHLKLYISKGTLNITTP